MASGDSVDIIVRQLLRGTRYSGQTWVLQGAGIRVYVSPRASRGNPLPIPHTNILLVHPDTPLTERQATHELVHFQQMKREGARFLPQMLVQNVMAFAGKEQPFETEAIAAEQKVPHFLEAPMPGSPAAQRVQPPSPAPPVPLSPPAPRQGVLAQAVPLAQKMASVSPTEATTRAVGKLLGLPADVVLLRFDTLDRLFNTQTTPEERLGWYNGLNSIDKVLFTLAPAAPYARHLIRAQQAIGASDTFQKFMADPKNKQWWFLSVSGRTDPTKDTPERVAFQKWYSDTAGQMVVRGTSQELILSDPLGKQMLDDFIAYIPWMFGPGAAPAGLASRLLVGPVLKGAGAAVRGIPVVGPWLSRFTMRTSQLIPDLLATKMLDSIDLAVKNGFLDEAAAAVARKTVPSFREQWVGRFKARLRAEGEAQEIITSTMKKFGLKPDHIHVHEGFSMDRSRVFRVWEGVQLKAQTAIAEANEALAKATDPGARKGIERYIKALHEDLAIQARKARADLAAITPESTAARMKKPWTLEDTAKAKKFNVEFRARMDVLHPPRSPGYRKFYYPSFNAPSIEQLLQNTPRIVDPYMLEMTGEKYSLTAEEAMRRWLQREALPIWNKMEASLVAEFRAWVDATALGLDAPTRAMLVEKLTGVGVKELGATPATTVNWLLNLWKDAVLVGRLPAWASINTFGNMTNVTKWLIGSWTRGHYVDPLDMFRRLEGGTPRYVVEGRLSKMAFGGEGVIPGLAQLRAGAYSVNSVIEMAFRSMVYKGEVATVLKEMAAKGVKMGPDAYEIAHKLGWDATDRTLYNYADRFVFAKSMHEWAPFLQYKLSNVRFWMEELTRNPWLVPMLARLANERPEYKVRIDSMFGFLKELGIEGITLDLVGKANVFDFLTVFADYEPKWMVENKKRLGLEWANLQKKAQKVPEGARDLWIKAELETAPDLKAYVEYLEQGVLVQLAGYGARTFGASGPATWLMTKMDVQPRKFRDMPAGSFIPQQELIGYIAYRIARRVGASHEEVKSWLREPTDTEIKREMRRMQVEGIQTGKPVDTADPAVNEALYNKARDNVFERRLYQKGFSLALGQQWMLKHMDDLHDVTMTTPGYDPADPRSRRDPAPRPSEVYEVLRRTGLDRPGINPGVDQATAEKWAMWLAGHEKLRSLALTTPEERRAQRAVMDALPEDLRKLRETTDPVTARLFQIVQEGFDTLSNLTGAKERKEFWESDSLQVRLMQAFMRARFTVPEKVLLDEVGHLTRADTEKWYNINRITNPEKARLFKDLYPTDASTFETRDVYGPPTTTVQPVAPTTRSEVLSGGPTEPPSPLVGAVPTRMSPTGRDALRNREKLHLEAYMDDPAEQKKWRDENVRRKEAGLPPLTEADYRGRWAIGYGYNPTKRGVVTAGMKITEAEANHYFDNSLAAAERSVVRLVKTPLNQNQFDALVDFVYNAGAGALEGSSMLRHINAPWKTSEERKASLEKAAVGLSQWGSEQWALAPGLKTRRLENATLFRAPSPVPTIASSALLPTTVAAGPDIRGVPADRRDAYRTFNAAKDIVYHANITQAMAEFMRRVNPALDPAAAQRVAAMVMANQENPSRVADWHAFDPLWIMGIIAVRSKGDPSFEKGGRFGLTGLTPTQAQLHREDLLDPVKNVRAAIEFFKDIQARYGTQAAVEAFGLVYSDVAAMAGRVIGLRAVTYGAPREKQPRPVIGAVDSEEEKKYTTFFNDLLFAGGSPDDPGFRRRWAQEVGEIARKADSRMLAMLKINAPDLAFHVNQARLGKTVWYEGRAVVEDAGLGTDGQEYMAWKHTILGADSPSAALAAWSAGPGRFRERFAAHNVDMANFFEDKKAGVSRIYDGYEFSVSQERPFLEAKRRIAVALASNDPAVVKATVAEIKSQWGDIAFPRILSELKKDSPALHRAMEPFMTQVPYGPEERLRVRAFIVGINSKIADAKIRPAALGEAVAIFDNPENAGLVALAMAHETAWYANTRSLLAGNPPVGHYVSGPEHLSYSQWKEALKDAHTSRNASLLRETFYAAPEHFRQEFMAHSDGAFSNYAPILEGVEPQEWVFQRERNLYKPYGDFLAANDAYGSYSPIKLEMIEKENPAAAGWLIQHGGVMDNITNGVRQRLAGLYAGILRQYDYNPSILNAIPDDGTRYLLTLMDPNAKQMFERHKLPVTPVEFPRVKTPQEVWGEDVKVSVERDGAGNVVYRIKRRVPAEDVRLPDTWEEITMSQERIAQELGAISRLKSVDPKTLAAQESLRKAQAISAALGYVGQGIQIAMAGGGFMEQLPAYFQAAQAAAAAGLLGPAAFALLGGPVGLVAGTVLGILGGIFGAARRKAEEERQKAIQLEQQRTQATERAFALVEQIRAMDKRAISAVEARTGAFSRFLEKPSAITRQGLLEAVGSVPRPSW